MSLKRIRGNYAQNYAQHAEVVRPFEEVNIDEYINKKAVVTDKEEEGNSTVYNILQLIVDKFEETEKLPLKVFGNFNEKYSVLSFFVYEGNFEVDDNFIFSDGLYGLYGNSIDLNVINETKMTIDNLVEYAVFMGEYNSISFELHYKEILSDVEVLVYEVIKYAKKFLRASKKLKELKKDIFNAIDDILLSLG